MLRHKALVWHLVYRMVQHPEDARELSQDVFLRVHECLHQYRFESSLATWIGRIAFTVTTRHLQKKRLSMAAPMCAITSASAQAASRSKPSATCSSAEPESSSSTGSTIGKLKMERFLEDWVQKILGEQAAHHSDEQPSWVERFEAGGAHVKEIVGKVWPYILAGIALGAGIHGYVPEDFMASFMGKDVWWAVPAAVLLGVPMYTNAAGVIPIVEALIGKGAAMGTVLAFMMSVIALSAPEMIILRKALKPTLIATFAGVVAAGILLVGYVFNWVL